MTTSTGPSTGAGFEQGGIWRIPPGGEAELWLRHELLTSLGRDDIPSPVPLGANGLAYHNRSLYVANSEKRNIIRVSVEADGSAGAPETVFQFDRHWDVLDGIAVDDNGDIYVLVIGQSELVRISAERNSVMTIASGADGLDLPASLAFGQGQNSGNVFLTNYAFLPADAPIRPSTRCETPCPGIVRVSLSPPTLPETGSPGSGPVVFALIGTAVVLVGFVVRRRLAARRRARSTYVA